MSALAKPLFYSSSAENPDEVVNAELVVSLTKVDLVDTQLSANSRYKIIFQMKAPYKTIEWIYKVQATRNTAFTAIKGAIATAST